MFNTIMTQYCLSNLFKDSTDGGYLKKRLNTFSTRKWINA